MNIDTEILDLIKKLGKDFNILNYVYNKNNFNKEKDTIYYSGPYWDNKEIIAAIKSLLIGKWISAGEQVQKFEQEFSKKINQKYSLMLNSGSSANLVIMASLKKYYNWSDSDEIIISVVGFPTTLSPIIQNSLKPVFVDIEMNTLNFNVNIIEQKITKNTKAILVSPVLGNTPDLDKIINLCEKYNLKLILDSCDSLGSKWKNKYLNEYAEISSFSFYPSHHISTGEGGMISSNNKELMKICKSISCWGRDCTCTGITNLLKDGSCKNRFSNWLKNYDGIIDHKYVFVNEGYNLKPLDLQGSIGLEQLKKLEEICNKHRLSKNRISNIFKKYIDVKIPEEDINAVTSWFGTPIVCNTEQEKNKIVSFLELNKIQTRNYFAGNILLHPAFEHLGNFKDFPIANNVLRLVFFVGSSPHYNTKTFEYFEEIIKKISMGI